MMSKIRGPVTAIGNLLAAAVRGRASAAAWSALAAVGLGAAGLVGAAACGTPSSSASAAAPAAESGAAPLARWNVLLVTIDTLRADRVGAYGYAAARTPVLDRLAAQGTRFEQAMAHAPLTLPSHASIMTGLFPSAHGVRDNATFALDDHATTLAERLHAVGYRTGAFVSSFILNGQYGLSQGFDRYDDALPQSAAVLDYDVQRAGAQTVAAASAWIAEGRGEARAGASGPSPPFFAWVHLFEPHTPYDPPPAFRDLKDPYDGEVAAADAALGTLIAALRGAGLADRTVIVVTADHGEGLGEHGEREHGLLLYDSTLHVPLIIDVPGGAPHVVRTQVRHVDLFPTVLRFAGVADAGGVAGVALQPFLERGDAAATGRARDADVSYAETWYGRLHFGWSELRALRADQWKFVDAPRPELFDLQSDPRERTNVIAQQASRLPAMRDALARVATPPAVTAATPVPLEGTAVERLRALGYVSGAVAGGGAAGGAGRRPDPKDKIAEFERYNAGLNAGIADLDRVQPAAAVRRFQALARTYPESFEVHQYLGYALAAVGRHQDALAEYDRALEIFPAYALAHVNAARSLSALGRRDEAKQRLARGLALEPRSAYGQLVGGVLAWEAGDPAGARAFFERAVALNPAAPAYRANLAEALMRVGDYPRALAEYETLYRAGFQPAAVLFNIGVIRERLGDLAAARRAYGEALRVQPTLEPARRALAELARRSTPNPPPPSPR